MISFLSAITFVFLLGLLSQFIFPWWTLAIAAGIGTLIFADRSSIALAAGAIGAGLLWLISALVFHSEFGGGIAGRIAELISLPSIFWTYLITLIIAAVVGGLGGLTGYYLRASFSAQS